MGFQNSGLKALRMVIWILINKRKAEANIAKKKQHFLILISQKTHDFQETQPFTASLSRSVKDLKPERDPFRFCSAFVFVRLSFFGRCTCLVCGSPQKMCPESNPPFLEKAVLQNSLMQSRSHHPFPVLSHDKPQSSLGEIIARGRSLRPGVLHTPG